jgi:two-component system response regulator FixJ
MSSEVAVVHVVDDDEAMRQSMAFLLRTANLEPRTYESGSAFLEALPDVKGGCIVTDVRMPGMTGIDLMKRLRELNVTMPVIVITGHGDVPLAVEAMKGGALDFLEKPFDDDVLLAAVRSALSAQATDSERQALNAKIRERLA